MKPSLLFLLEMEQELEEVHMYRTLPFNPNRHNCTKIAENMARLLVDEGESPRVIRIGERDVNKLIPKKFPLMVSWDYHDVCCLDSNVIDPILGRYCYINQYLDLVFGQQYGMNPHQLLNQKIARWIKERRVHLK